MPARKSILARVQRSITMWSILTAGVLLGAALPADGDVVFHYRFETGGDGDAVTTALDSGPNALHSTKVNLVTYTDDRPNTADAGTFALDASGDLDYVEVADNADMHVASDFTLEAYARPNEPYDSSIPKDIHHIVNKKTGDVGSGLSSWVLWYDHADDVFAGAIDISPDTETSLIAVAAEPGYDGGQWYHLALVFDKDVSGSDDRLALYINHQLVDEETGSDLGDVYYSNDELVIGAGNFNAFDDEWRRNFGGLIDEVRLSNEALGPGQFLINIPEPATLGLLTLGGLALIRRRR